MLEQLKQAIDNYFGMTSELVHYRADSATLVYTSPTGVMLFDISLGCYKGVWEFEGHGGAIPNSMRELTKISKTYNEKDY